MKTVEITPQAHEDLAALKSYLAQEFGGETAKKILGKIYDDLEKLSVFPQMGDNILAPYGIVTDYLCLVTHKNYVFYRIEGECVKIIRILDERRDFLRVLFGISEVLDEAEEKEM